MPKPKADAVVQVIPGGEGGDATLTMSAEDAAAADRGEVDLSSLFMQGRLKATGNMALVLPLLEEDFLKRRA